VGTESYCREIEAYLCRKNDGHLIRVVGPSFELVAGWASQGVPLKIAFSGIDRYFERYYRQGPRRRPVRIDFCEADVLDVFDEWRRAIGAARQSSVASPQSSVSLPEHLKRVVVKLSSARASGAIDPACDQVIDRVAGELEAARQHARGVRGAARQALIERLTALDHDLLAIVRQSLSADTVAGLAREADEELAAFRASMTPDAFERVRQAALGRLIRERFRLPTIAFE